MINATGNAMTREIQRQSRLAAQLAETQVQISTGKQIQRASDDPVASARLSGIATQQANDASWARNLSLGNAHTAQADTVLATVSDLVVRGQELTLAAANPGINAADRATLAVEISALADEIDALSASTSVLGQPLFASGAPLEMRFGAELQFAPVGSRSSTFEVGGLSVTQHLRAANTAILSGDPVQMAATRANVAASVNHIADARAQIGINASRLDRLRESQASQSIALSAERSTLEDTDLTSAIAKLNGQTITLEAAQAAFARINRRTLFDILN